MWGWPWFSLRPRRPLSPFWRGFVSVFVPIPWPRPPEELSAARLQEEAWAETGRHLNNAMVEFEAHHMTAEQRAALAKLREADGSCAPVYQPPRAPSRADPR